jgi:hypothetical protein
MFRGWGHAVGRARACRLDRAEYAEVIEEFAKYIEMIVPVFDLESVQARYEIGRVHQWSPNSSLKRASSRTKSSKRRRAAASSRKANQVSALAENAHNSRARCARSPRSLKMRIRSDMYVTEDFTAVFAPTRA